MRIQSPALAGIAGVRHGFFGRRGGVSEGLWASLNVGLRSGDRPERIAANRALAAAELDVEPGRLVTARQVHGAGVLTVAEPWDNLQPPEADALVSDRLELLLGVLTADCGPVLLADATAGVIGAAHAGWKGALGGVLEAVVAAMGGLGARPGRITAALGPCIGQPSYEVGPEFAARFAEAEPGSQRARQPRGWAGFGAGAAAWAPAGLPSHSSMPKAVPRSAGSGARRVTARRLVSRLIQDTSDDFDMTRLL